MFGCRRDSFSPFDDRVLQNVEFRDLSSVERDSRRCVYAFWQPSELCRVHGS